MSEVTGPIIAIALVLCAVFIPTAFISGLTGQFYRQFALTIAISTVISAFNSLTLSPALAALLLKPHDAPPDRLHARASTPRSAGSSGRSTASSTWPSQRYVARRRRACCARASIALVVYVGLLALTGSASRACPTGFMPAQDKQYLVALRAAARRRVARPHRGRDPPHDRHRAEDARRRARRRVPGLLDQRLRATRRTPASCSSALKPFEERTTTPTMSAGGDRERAERRSSRRSRTRSSRSSRRRRCRASARSAASSCRSRTARDLGYDDALRRRRRSVDRRRRSKRPELAGVFSSFQVNVPQLDADVDREKAKAQGVPLQNVFETMQIYLGSLYVNDFNRFGRTYQVNAQADAPFRARARRHRASSRRATHAGEMVPLGSLRQRRARRSGPTACTHYNGYPAAEINGGAGARLSVRPGRGGDREARRRRSCRTA